MRRRNRNIKTDLKDIVYVGGCEPGSFGSE
jgi:hypothetical protein